jgi:hypothetical protein
VRNVQRNGRSHEPLRPARGTQRTVGPTRRRRRLP